MKPRQFLTQRLNIEVPGLTSDRVAQSESLLDRWRRQIGPLRRQNRPLRPLAALGYVTHTEPIDGWIELERLILVVVRDDDTGLHGPRVAAAGFSGARVPFGISWGGDSRRRFCKDLRLAPQLKGTGPRFNLDNENLLLEALELETLVARRFRHSEGRINSRLRLPPLWAAFRPRRAESLKGDGPEFIGACHRAGLSGKELVAETRRSLFNLALFPLEWVSHVLEDALAVFVDLRSFDRRQVFHCADADEALRGYRGACEFDFDTTLTGPNPKTVSPASVPAFAAASA